MTGPRAYADRERPSWSQPLAPLADWLKSVDTLIDEQRSRPSRCPRYFQQNDPRRPSPSGSTLPIPSLRSPAERKVWLRAYKRQLVEKWSDPSGRGPQTPSRRAVPRCPTAASSS